MPRSFPATATIPHAASPAAAEDVAAVARRTPRGNEIHRASAPPVRTSAVDSSPSSPLDRRENRCVSRAIAVSICAPTQVPTPPRPSSVPSPRVVVVPGSQSSALRSLSLTVRSRSDISALRGTSWFNLILTRPRAGCTHGFQEYSAPERTRDRRPSRTGFEIQSRRSMADEDGPRQPLEVLRNAARGGQERFLVALGDGVERPRITGALNSEGFVLEVGSVPEGLARLADESFDLAILDLPDAELQSAPSARDPLAAWREMRPFTDLVL